MKTILPTLIILSAAACAPAPSDSRLTEHQQRALAAELGTRVPGPEQTCLPNHRSNELVRAGGQILYRSGADLYLARTQGGCEAIDDPNTALVVEYRGTNELCRGQQAKVVDTTGGFLRGSCTIEGFTPYRATSRL